MSQGKILVIEDDPWWMNEFRGMFHEHPDLKNFEMVEASSLAAARDFFSKKFEAEVITVDGMLQDGDIEDSVGFVMELRAKGYKKDLIAASSSKPFRNRLLRAGCNHECSKSGLIETIAKIVLVRK